MRIVTLRSHQFNGRGLFMQVIFKAGSMEMKKIALLFGLCASGTQALAHPGHGDSILDEIVHMLTGAEHLPITLVVGVVLVTGLMLWQSRR
jgi:hydrogenase/urease accessory protein HupE